MKKIILSAIALVGAMTLNAQEDAPKLSVSGTVDAITGTYLTHEMASLQVFLHLKKHGFALGMANLYLAYEGEKSGVVADLSFWTKRLMTANMADNLTNCMLTGT